MNLPHFRLATLLIAALFSAPLISAACVQGAADVPPTTGETQAERDANLAKSQEYLEKVQDAARRCHSMKWKVDISTDIFLLYPISAEDAETIRHILLNKAHAVCFAEVDYDIDFWVYLVLYDKNGREIMEVRWPIGTDSETNEHGYQEGQRISVPDADSEILRKITPWETFQQDYWNL